MTDEERTERGLVASKAGRLGPKVEQWIYLHRKAFGRMMSGKPRSAHLSWIDRAWRNIKESAEPAVLAVALENLLRRESQETAHLEQAAKRSGKTIPKPHNPMRWHHVKR